MKNAIAKSKNNNNKLLAEDRGIHDWYRFVLSFPPHLVRTYIEQFKINEKQCVLDPFCGTGTTLVECKKLGIPSVGVESSPVAHFASQVKVDWSPPPTELLAHAQKVVEATAIELKQQGIEDIPAINLVPNGRKLRSLPQDALKLLLKDSISPLPLHKAIILSDCLEKLRDERFYAHERLALAKALVFSISNLHFGPEVGVGTIKTDSPVIYPWLTEIKAISKDLTNFGSRNETKSTVHLGDSREILQNIAPGSISAVITSPPYPNEKDYTRTTRLEAVLLGFIKNREELRAIKERLIRSNTRNVYKADTDDLLVEDFPEIQGIADAIEARRIELGKTSGFERLYPRVTKLYFGGMLRHLADLRTVLHPGAHLAYVVGDQASYLQVMIHTGQILAKIGKHLGYELVDIDLFRTRRATATRAELREEVVILRWPG